MKKTLRILFIGNSHTYYNDMPEMVAGRFRDQGYDCQTTMLAHPGWYLKQHINDPDVRYNIRYGKYDYVVLQEHAHPFGPEEDFIEAAVILDGWIREAGSIPVIYMTWAREKEEEEQARMTAVHKRVADRIGALIAPVGECWWDYKRSRPDIRLYNKDGAHASREGSDFAAKVIWDAIYRDLKRRDEGHGEQDE